jgi:tight adherence protein B
MASIAVAFVFIFSIVAAAMVVASKQLEARRKKQVNELLSTVTRVTAAPAALLKDPDTERPPFLERCGAHKVIEFIETQTAQAGLDWTPERFASLTAFAAGVGALLGLGLPLPFPPALRVLAFGGAGLLLPLLKLRRARAKRLAAFEEQFPDALDFLARSMRAGHAFTISLEMLSEEMPDPLGKEVRTLFNEHNLGAPLETALAKLTARVPLIDVRFFASAVMLQKQTGGNLNEILTRLAYVIRERFRLKGQVRAASAHGRTTAGILAALPVVTFVALFLVAPSYIQGMLADPDGKSLLAGCIAAQIVGNFVIRRIIDIKV